MPTPPNTPPRSFASMRDLAQRKPRLVHRGLDEIPDLPLHMTRRGVVRSFLVGVGGLTLGSVSGCRKDEAASDSGWTGGSADIEPWMPEQDLGVGVGAWLHIDSEDQVTITIVKNEMGQGIATGMAMVVAEELDADWEKVRMVLRAEMNETDLPGWSDGTWGSTSMSDNYEALREIGAAAREMLVQVAAESWGVSPESCSTSMGQVSHPDHGQLSYGSLAEEASLLSVPARPALKQSADFSLIGAEKTRLDIEAHVRGETVYGIDVVVEDMLCAAVKQSPVFGGEIANLSELSVEGTEATAVLSLPNGVAVLAESWWVAKTVLDQLDLRFETPVEMDGLSTEIMTEDFIVGLDGASATGVAEGNADLALEEAVTVVEALYGAPMLAHAPMEPMACAADVRSDSCTLWISTQYAKGAQAAVSSVTGIPSEDITVHAMALGGGFGRKAETDYATQAAVLSQSIGRPVKVIWTREEEIQHGYYRPPAQGRITGGLDADGNIVAWRAQAAGTSYFNAGSSWNLTGFHDFVYTIPNQHIAWAGFSYGLPFGYLRAPGHNTFNFMVESFIDELAEAAGEDPLSFRLRHLEGETRALQVLERVAVMADWGNPSRSGAQHGISLMIWGADSFIAQIAEVSLDEDQTLTVHQVWAAVDAGRVINPDLARAQIEGGVVFGLSTGLFGEITLTDGSVDQSNFHDYPLLKMARAPHVEVEFIESEDDPGGVGELAVGGAISAVLNAMARVDGARVRSLPITRHGYR